MKNNRVEKLLGVAEAMWGVIANASGGNWDLESEEWREAAERVRDSYLEASRLFPEEECCQEELSGSEALYGFVGWLTTIPERTIMSSADDASSMPKKIDTFCQANGLLEPRKNWSDRLVHPVETKIE